MTFAPDATDRVVGGARRRCRARPEPPTQRGGATTVASGAPACRVGECHAGGEPRHGDERRSKGRLDQEEARRPRTR